MYFHAYTCPVCGNPVELQSCPFDDSVAGQCEFCNNKIEILRGDYEEWKEAKDGS